VLIGFLPMAAAFQVMEHSTQLAAEKDFEGLKASLKGIAAKSGGHIDQTTIEAVNTILDSVNTTLMDALEQDRSHTQNILNIARDGVLRCDTNRDAWFGTGGTFEILNSDVTADGATHSSCRGEEATEFANMTSHCDTVDRQVAQWNICEMPGDFTAGDTDAINTYVCCLTTFFDNNRGTYYTHRQNCIDATNVHSAKRAECNGAQGAFEAEFCGRETAVQNNCEIYRNCRTNEETNWLKVTQETQAIEEIFQAQRVALECLLCYGTKILNNETDLSSCEVAINCASLSWCPTIVYDDITDFTGCSEPVGDDNIPCAAGFVATWYQAWSNEGSSDFRVCDEHHGGGRPTANGPENWGVPSTNGNTIAPSPVDDCTACSSTAHNTEQGQVSTPTAPTF